MRGSAPTLTDRGLSFLVALGEARPPAIPHDWRQVMAEAPELPLQMRRDGFDPVGELARLRDSDGVAVVGTPFGVPA